jgi:GAF domain-containing protein
MWNSIIKFFTPPVFSTDENKTRVARYVHWIALAFMLAILAYILFSKIGSGSFAFNFFDLTLIGVFLVISAIWGMAKNGYVRLASILLVVILWVAVNGTAFYGAGVRDSSFIANFVVLLAAGLLVGWGAAVSLSVLTIAAGIVLASAEAAGLTPFVYSPASPVIASYEMAVIFVIFAAFIYLLISGLESAIKSAQAGTTQLEKANLELNSARVRLEENHNELLIANEQLKRRAERMSTISNISKTITLVQQMERLLPSVVNTISQRFGLYHAAIYLLDESKQVAVLRAAGSEGGLRMLKRGQRVDVAGQGIISVVVNRGEARIALDVGSNPVKFDNLDLPDTRSQIALPLKVGEVVIGVLDIQSVEPNAFTEEDVSALLILADQAAIAIQNAHSSEQVEEALRRAEVASQQLTGKAWKGYLETIEQRGYRYDGVKPERLKEAGFSSEPKNGISIPVRLRGQTIGRLKLNPPEASRRWTEDEIAMAEATAERVALALEGARLLDDAQKTAARETFLSDVSAKLGASFQLDSILRDTVEELGQTLKNSTVSFQLVNPSSPSIHIASSGDSARQNKGGNHE